MQQTMAPQGMTDKGDPVVEPDKGKVKLYAKGKRVGGQIEWSLDKEEHSEASGEVTRIEVPKDSGPCEVTIKVKVKGEDLLFDRARPLSASQTGCPPKNSGIDTGQIDPDKVSVNRKGDEVTFTDLNTDSLDIHYALNFVGAEPFDPMIRNR